MSELDTESLCDQGRELLQKKDLQGAAAVFKSVVEVDPDCCDAHEGLATCAYMSGDYAGAIAEFQKLTLLQPMESRYYTNLGAIHNRIGEHMKAADFLRKAIQRNKKCAESYYNLGIAQRKLKQNSMAVSAYKEALKIDPMMVEAYQNLGNVFVDMGNLQMAILNFKKALEIRPEFERARVGLEKAEEQLAAAKSKNSAIGRLSAMESTVTTVMGVSTRELRDDERYEDRKCVKKLADEIERLAKGCVEHLRQNLIPAVLEVERAMAHGADEVFVLAEAAQAFKNASTQWTALRRTLKKKVAELADHEQFINAPNTTT
ncbi:MAG: tetratricopeptide repeat protein [Planctomycetes bacterium]|nr:tetratricopeptide repeat protein [Planctomycetota bacterium]